MNIPVEMTKVESSNIEAIGFDGDKLHLYVRFRDKTVHRYLEIEPAAHRLLMASESKGRFLSKCIIGKHLSEKVIEEPLP